MAFNLKVIDSSAGISFDCKRSGIKGTPVPVPAPFSPEGKPVNRKMVNKDTLQPVSGSYKYIDTDGKTWEKNELIWKLDDQICSLTEMTTVFNIIEYRPLADYTDFFNIEDYQEFNPDTSDKDTKQSDIPRITATNLMGVRRLWTKLHDEHVVAAGEFNSTTGGTKGGTALIRAISKMILTSGDQLTNKWGLELGTCREEKIFNYLFEGEPVIVEATQEAPRVRSGLLRR